MALMADLFCDAVFKYPRGDTSKTHFLTVTPPHISFLSNIYNLLTKSGALVEQVVDTLKTEFYEHNIRGGYNTKIIM